MSDSIFGWQMPPSEFSTGVPLTATAQRTVATVANTPTTATNFSLGNTLGGFVDLFGARLATNLADKAAGVKKEPAPSTENTANNPLEPQRMQYQLPSWMTPGNAIAAVAVVGGLVLLMSVFRGGKSP